MERTVAKTSTSKSYDRPEKYERESLSTDFDSGRLEQENRELRIKISHLEAELSDKEAELTRLRSQRPSGAIDIKFDRSEIERYRAAQLQAERLLEAREQSHRQQVARLESQVSCNH